MKTASSFLIILLFAGVIFYSGCKDSITAAKIDKVVIPDTNVSYSKYIQPVLNLHCTPCHGNGEVAGGVNLTTWDLTTSDPSVVFPGRPENSILVWAIEGGYQGNASPMPPLGSSYSALNTNQVNGIKEWIKEGAKKN